MTRHGRWTRCTEAPDSAPFSSFLPARGLYPQPLNRLRVFFVLGAGSAMRVLNFCRLAQIL